MSTTGSLFPIFEEKIARLLTADDHVVNSVLLEHTELFFFNEIFAPHSSLPVLATSGIEHSVKIWQPGDENLSPLDPQEISECWR